MHLHLKSRKAPLPLSLVISSKLPSGQARAVVTFQSILRKETNGNRVLVPESLASHRLERHEHYGTR